MSVSKRRVRAIFGKELREYRRNGFIIATMAIIPLIFVIFPLIEVLALPASAASALLNGDPLAFLLGIPAIVPAVVAAYSVVGERQQGTLEPVLTTPIPREEFLLGKALAALLPSLAISIAVYAFFLACIDLFARPAVASAVFQGPDLLAQVAFTPSSPARRSGSASPFRPGRATSASHNRSALWRASRRSRSGISSRSM
jgi:ABC-type transport system involved in multi-copper enzyme maturation permease subunit